MRKFFRDLDTYSRAILALMGLLALFAAFIALPTQVKGNTRRIETVEAKQKTQDSLNVLDAAWKREHDADDKRIFCYLEAISKDQQGVVCR